MITQKIRDALAQTLRGTYDCGRVWEAWQVGTMTEEDFTPVDENDERLDEIAAAVIGAWEQPAWVAYLEKSLNRRTGIEAELYDMAAGKRELPDRDRCRAMANELGVPEEFKHRAPYSPSRLLAQPEQRGEVVPKKFQMVDPWDDRLPNDDTAPPSPTEPSDWVDDQGQPRVTPRPAPHKRPPPTAAEARALHASAPAPPAPTVPDEVALFRWLQENEADLRTWREPCGEDEYLIWWQVVKGRKSISGHPLGSPQDAIRAAMLAAAPEPSRG